MKRATVRVWRVSGIITLLLFTACAYVMASYPPVGAAGVTGGFLIVAAATGFVVTLATAMDGGRVKVPLPYPDRARNLEGRLGKVSVMKREVMKNIERLPEGNAYKTALRSRYDELAAAEEVLKVEMTAKELVDLDKRAARLVRKELG